MTYNGKSKVIQALVYAINNLPVMKGADGSTAGEKGLVPAPAAEDNEKFLRGDGKWAKVSTGGGGEAGKWTKLLDVTEQSSQTASSYDLADDITNYNTIAVAAYAYIGSTLYMDSKAFPEDLIVPGVSMHNSELDHTRVCTYKFPTTKSIANVAQSGGTYVYKVYGYN